MSGNGGLVQVAVKLLPVDDPTVMTRRVTELVVHCGGPQTLSMVKGIHDGSPGSLTIIRGTVLHFTMDMGIAHQLLAVFNWIESVTFVRSHKQSGLSPGLEKMLEEKPKRRRRDRSPSSPPGSPGVAGGGYSPASPQYSPSSPLYKAGSPPSF